jgi:hypothetical protein
MLQIHPKHRRLRVIQANKPKLEATQCVVHVLALESIPEGSLVAGLRLQGIIELHSIWMTTVRYERNPV